MIAQQKLAIKSLRKDVDEAQHQAMQHAKADIQVQGMLERMRVRLSPGVPSHTLTHPRLTKSQRWPFIALHKIHVCISSSLISPAHGEPTLGTGEQYIGKS